MRENNTIGLACDHAGFSLKEIIKEFLLEKGYKVEDFGTFSEESVDYPDYIHPLAYKINIDEIKQGIIFCGSGNGVAMTANKYPNVRAALCWKEEISILSRKHNDANILSLPARFISNEEAKAIVSSFFNTSFEGGRHQMRVNKINKIII